MLRIAIEARQSKAMASIAVRCLTLQAESRKDMYESSHNGKRITGIRETL